VNDLNCSKNEESILDAFIFLLIDKNLKKLSLKKLNYLLGDILNLFSFRYMD